jgi:hypothetical protein
MMLSWSNPEGQLCSQRSSERSERFRRVITAITAFFEAEMAAGRLRRRNAEVLARLLLGSLHHFCVSEHVAPGVVGMSAHDFAREIVDVLLSAGAVPAGARG